MQAGSLYTDEAKPNSSATRDEVRECIAGHIAHMYMPDCQNDRVRALVLNGLAKELGKLGDLAVVYAETITDTFDDPGEWTTEDDEVVEA